MAHHPQETRPLPLQLLERPQVLHRDDDRDEFSGLGDDRGRVQERPHAAAVRHRQLDLLRAQRRGAIDLELPGEGEFRQRNLPPVGPPAGQHVQQLFRGRTRGADRLDDALGRAVDRQHAAGAGLEHRHAHRRGLDQGLEVGPRARNVPVRTRVRDRRGRLRGEEHQDLLVLGRERLAVLLVSEEELPEMRVPMAQPGALQRRQDPGIRGEADRPQIGGHIGQLERHRNMPQMLVEPLPVGPLRHHPALLGSKTGGDEVSHLSALVDRGDHALARAGERPAAVDDLAEHGGQVEARADAQDGGAQAGEPVPQRPVVSPEASVVSPELSLLSLESSWIVHDEISHENMITTEK